MTSLTEKKTNLVHVILSTEGIKEYKVQNMFFSANEILRDTDRTYIREEDIVTIIENSHIGAIRVNSLPSNMTVINRR